MKIQQLDLTIREPVAGCHDDSDDSMGGCGWFHGAPSSLTNYLVQSIITVNVRQGVFNGD